MCFMRRGRGQEGFTLIELLVVIAIIAILAAILFPVYSQAKKSAYVTTCKSNLKNFASAFRMYGDDWEGRYPVAGGVTGGKPQSMTWLASGSAGSLQQVGGLYPYIRAQVKPGDKSNLWSCPMAAPLANIPAVGYSPGSSYVMNDYIRSYTEGQLDNSPGLGDPRFTTGLKVSLVRFPTKTILLYEGVQGPDGTCTRQGSPFYWKSYSAPYGGRTQDQSHASFKDMKYAGIAQNYHAGKCNFLMLDGHVELMEPGKTVSEHTFNSYKTHKYFSKWIEIHDTFGEFDFWDPRVPGVTYP